MFAAGNDLMAISSHLSINDITQCAAAAVLHRPADRVLDHQADLPEPAARRPTKVLHGRETGTIWRHADGRFEEIHAPLTPAERWPLVQHESPEPLARHPGSTPTVSPAPSPGRSDCAPSCRGSTSRTVAPATPSELEAAHHEHDVEEAQPVSVAPEEIEPAARHSPGDRSRAGQGTAHQRGGPSRVPSSLAFASLR